MKTIVFLLEKITQPRCVKRIKSIIDMGISYEVYGFEDGSYNYDLTRLPFKITGLLEYPSCHSFTDKIKANIYPFIALNKIIKNGGSNTVFYVFGYELAKILFLLGCRNYVYEEADINSAKYSNRFRRRLAIWLDKRIALKSLLTIYTSEGFVDYLFGNDSCKPNYIIIPNKLSSYFNESKRENTRYHINPSRIRFGFIGLIRYPQTIFRFATVIAKKYPKYEFHFFGDLSKGLVVPDELKNSRNVFFHGSFSNPEDLEEIYSKLDVNIACYDTVSVKYSINVRVAEPNKLYESIYFKVPIIVSSGTYVGEKVKRLGIGTAIDCSNDNSITKFLESIDTKALERYSNNASKIEADDLIYNPTELKNNLRHLLQ